MPKQLPKKHEKLTAENFKFIRKSGVIYYWSFKFGVDGYTENEIVIQPFGGGAKVTLFDSNGAALMPTKEVEIKLAKKKGADPVINQKDLARVLRAANDLYSKFYV